MSGASVSPTNPALSISELSHSFDGEVVLHEISLKWSSPMFVSVLGPSGCGKTTLLKCAAGLLRYSSGKIDLGGLSPYEARSRGVIGFAFQSPTLLPWRTALGNVLLPAEILPESDGGNKEMERAKHLLSLVDLGGHFDKYPREMSGGMQQRVGLARALVTSPSYLFLDEPFGALDGITRDRLNEKLRALFEGSRLIVICVTHSVEEAIFLADQVVILSRNPATIRAVVDIDLGSRRGVDVRFTEKFFDYSRKVRELIGEDL